jgi:hypothetical protein
MPDYGSNLSIVILTELLINLSPNRIFDTQECKIENVNVSSNSQHKCVNIYNVVYSDNSIFVSKLITCLYDRLVFLGSMKPALTELLNEK